MKIATWNTRGLGNKDRGRKVGILISNFQIQFIAIQETMVKNVSLRVLKEVWRGVTYNGVQVPSRGRSGGLVSCWRDDCFILKDHFQCQSWLVTFLTFIPNNVDVLIFNVYAPQNEVDKKEVWRHIAKMIGKWNGPTCVLGDFNSTVAPNERLREEVDVVNMDNFNDFIARANLIDQNIQNDMFTWDGPGGKKSRIDRILVNIEWLSLWPGAVVIAGDKNMSDHKPLIWGEKYLFWGPKPFRFFNGWFEFRKFIEVCKNFWFSYEVQGYSAHIVFSKCKLLKKDLKAWSDANVIKNKIELASLRSQIYELKKVEETRNLHSYEIIKLVEYKSPDRGSTQKIR
ncbi:uncharacterized protein [Rutidosis leptorrhynchoides]|uniref:uncharacterized protein n=1 Tax=Rutidosis leptorrhynchoides TaxID=125765 RepID=UPI003A9930BC